MVKKTKKVSNEQLLKEIQDLKKQLDNVKINLTITTPPALPVYPTYYPFYPSYLPTITWSQSNQIGIGNTNVVATYY